jgi:hypothetical protein
MNIGILLYRILQLLKSSAWYFSLSKKAMKLGSGEFFCALNRKLSVCCSRAGKRTGEQLPGYVPCMFVACVIPVIWTLRYGCSIQCT